MSATQEGPDRSWFRGRGGRRYALEFGLIIGIKLLLLLLIWLIAIRPQPHADTSPAAIERHFSAPVDKEPLR